jgi:hypothetical protein
MNVRMGALTQRNFTIARQGAVVFDVIGWLWRRGNVIGVITKEHIADEVAGSVRLYSR